MKKILCIFISALLALSLTACSPAFDGSRIGNEDELIMEYDMLNKTDAQDLELNAGDYIKAEIVVDDGHLAITIQKDDDEPIYESNGIVFSDNFDVQVEESGTYTVKVTGKKAKGSVSFIVESGE